MSFKVGDVCVVVECIGWLSPEMKYIIGCETTILGPPTMVDGSSGEHLRFPCHDPVYPNTGPFWLRPENLRLKRPPSKDDFTAGDWELMPWSPYKTKETTHG